MRAPNRPAAATPMAFARAIAAAYKRADASPAAALRLAGITAAQLNKPDARITARQMEALSAAAMQELDDEGLGAFERALPWGSYGMLARASLTSPTLGVALQRWCRHHGLLTRAIDVRLAESAGTATVTVDEQRVAPAAQREFALVHVLRNIHGLACWYVDSRIPLQGASFPYPRPPHADAYAHIFPGGPLAFDAPRAQVQFDARYLALPLRRDEKALRQMLQRALPLTVLQYRRDRLLVQQVRQALLADPAGLRSAGAIADRLHVSTRTLHRQLKEEGASLQQLKDDVRFERAKELLMRGRKPVKQVAAAVGFDSEKSFSRAFREWAGMTPSQVRNVPDRDAA